MVALIGIETFILKGSKTKLNDVSDWHTMMSVDLDLDPKSWRQDDRFHLIYIQHV